MRKFLSATVTAASLIVPSIVYSADNSVGTVPPADPYRQVSELVPLPDFIPGIGQLYVDPTTLPAGPFLAYNRAGVLVSTIYMIPLADLNPDKAFDDLAAPGGTVDHVDIQYNAGHPGVPVPHAHIVLWHGNVSTEQSVAQ